MDNPPGHSAVELNNEPQHQSTPTLGIEWHAVGLGLAVGMAWWLGQTLFWKFVINYLVANYSTSLFAAPWFFRLTVIFNFALPLAYGTIIGFAVGYRARFRIYTATTVTIVLLFILTFGLSWVLMAQMGSGAFASIFSASYMMQVSLPYALSLGAALNGAYLAQSVKRNRGVRIQ